MISWNCNWNPTDRGSALRNEIESSSVPEFRSQTLKPSELEIATNELEITLPPDDSDTANLPTIEPPDGPA